MRLAVDLEGYGGLRLGEGCRPLLRGEEPLFLRRMRSGPDKAARQRSSRVAETLSGDDQALWDNLRALRTRLAESQGVPPYVIFHDRALLAMAEHKPEDEDTLLTIDGVGAKKLAAYGEAFLAVIAGMAPEDAAALAAP